MFFWKSIVQLHLRQIVISATDFAIDTDNSPSTLMLHEDAFVAYFEPYRHPAAETDIWNNLGLTAYGRDWATLKTVSPDYVWTVVDSDGDQWITPGIHVVNRICYLVTRRPHLFLSLEFKSARRPTFLTPLGLKRQLSKINYAFASNRI